MTLRTPATSLAAPLALTLASAALALPTLALRRRKGVLPRR